jgi:hypothetical protein
MRLTIIPIDKKVIVDGVYKLPLDLTTCEIPSNVWALQWYDTEGEIEFDGKPKPLNEMITVLPDWANACIAVWETWIPPESIIPEDQPKAVGIQTA